MGINFKTDLYMHQVKNAIGLLFFLFLGFQLNAQEKILIQKSSESHRKAILLDKSFAFNFKLAVADHEQVNPGGRILHIAAHNSQGLKQIQWPLLFDEFCAEKKSESRRGDFPFSTKRATLGAQCLGIRFKPLVLNTIRREKNLFRRYTIS